MSGHFDDDLAPGVPAPTPAVPHVDCGDCPRVTQGCPEGHCLKAPPHKIQIGPLDV